MTTSFKNQISLKLAEQTNETSDPVHLGDFVVINAGSGQILSVKSTEGEIRAAMTEIDPDEEMDLEVAQVC